MKPASTAVRPVDWLLFNLRWLLLVVVGVVAFLNPGEKVFIAMLLLAAAAYNLVVMLMLAIEFWPTILPGLTLVMDSLLAISIFHVSGRATGPLVWVALFPILSAAIRFGWRTSLAATLVILASEAILVVRFEHGNLGMLWPLVFQGLFLLIAAVVAGLVGERVQAISARTLALEMERDSRRLRSVREQVRAVYQMASTVSATLDYERVLEAALDLGSLGAAEPGDPANLMVRAVLLLDEDGLYVATGRRLTPSDMRVSLPGKEGLVAEALKTGAPTYSSDPLRDPELINFVSFRSCTSLMCVPLGAGFEIFGVLLFGHPHPDFFGQDHLELLEAIANQTVVAMKNARLYQDLEAEKEHIVEVEEEARKKLARDLHDGPTQSIAAITMRVNYTRRLMERDLQAASAELFKVEDMARRTTKEIRHMLFTMRPLILESQGLVAALKQLAAKTFETHGQKVSMEARTDVIEDLEMGKQGVIFYIADEAINNARKHAEAEMIWVRLWQQDDVFVLEVQDNGVGFNVGAVDASYDQRGSLGMVNMRERAQLVNGLLRVESTEGKGTRIRVLVPLTEAAQERLRH